MAKLKKLIRHGQFVLRKNRTAVAIGAVYPVTATLALTGTLVGVKACHQPPLEPLMATAVERVMDTPTDENETPTEINISRNDLLLALAHSNLPPELLQRLCNKYGVQAAEIELLQSGEYAANLTPAVEPATTDLDLVP